MHIVKKVSGAVLLVIAVLLLVFGFSSSGGAQQNVADFQRLQGDCWEF